MSIKQTQVRTGNISVVNTEIKESLLGSNQFRDSLSYTDSGAGSTLLNMVVVGEVSASPGTFLPCVHTAVDGSQYPIGALWLGASESIAVGAGLTRSGLTVVDKGRIDVNDLTFGGASTIDSVVGGRTLRELLLSKGLILVNPVENTQFGEV